MVPPGQEVSSPSAALFASTKLRFASQKNTLACCSAASPPPPALASGSQIATRIPPVIPTEGFSPSGGTLRLPIACHPDRGLQPKHALAYTLSSRPRASARAEGPLRLPIACHPDRGLQPEWRDLAFTTSCHSGRGLQPEWRDLAFTTSCHPDRGL